MSLEIAAAAKAVSESTSMVKDVFTVFDQLKKKIVASGRDALTDSVTILGLVETSYDGILNSLREFVDLDLELPSARAKLEDFETGEGIARNLLAASIHCGKLNQIRKDHLDKIVSDFTLQSTLTKISSADSAFLSVVGDKLVAQLQAVAKEALTAYKAGDRQRAKQIIVDARTGLHDSRATAASQLAKLRKLILRLQRDVRSSPLS